MSRLSQLLGGLAAGILRSVTRSGTAGGTAARTPGRTRAGGPSGGGRRRGAGAPATRRTPTRGADEPGAQLPGQSGSSATVEVDPASLGTVEFRWEPDPDGRPDPGEVVWTWVPYEEHDGRGKDRPVLLVARRDADTLVGVQLTSRSHDGLPDEADTAPVGTGGWDPEHRPSWARLDRVFLVHAGGMRREGSAVDAAVFRTVTDRLRARWSR